MLNVIYLTYNEKLSSDRGLHFPRHQWMFSSPLESKYCPVPDTRLSLSIRYHCHGARAILFSFPPLVNLWICAVATPGMIRHAVMMAKLGRISYHMITALNCQATKSNSDDNQVALLPSTAYFAKKLTKCRPSWRPSRTRIILPVGYLSKENLQRLRYLTRIICVQTTSLLCCQTFVYILKKMLPYL